MTGAELKALRQRAELKTGDMAGRLGITSSTLSRYEHGHQPVPKAVGLAAQHIYHLTTVATADDRLLGALREIVGGVVDG